ncbi:MAG: hypothetical protein ACTSUJ_05430 [Candidatus Njordarchaeales archaeon]
MNNENERVDIVEHITWVIDALLSLAPSRNLLIQFLDMLPMKLSEAREIFSEIFEDAEIWEYLKEAFKIKVTEEGVVELENYNNWVKDFLETIRKFLKAIADPKLRAILTILSNKHMKIPNLDREYFERKIEVVLEDEELKPKLFKVLRTFVAHDTSIIYIDDLKKESGLSDDELEVALYILELYKIIKPRESYSSRLELFFDTYLDYIREYLLSEKDEP